MCYSDDTPINNPFTSSWFFDLFYFYFETSNGETEWMIKAYSYDESPKYKNEYNSMSFTDIKLKFGVVVADSHSQNTVR